VTDLYVADLSSHMNKDPLLVNFQNGVGYIPTGKLMKPHPSHLCSLMAGGEYHPKPIGTRSRFREFLLDVANGNEEVVRWKILWLGYCLSGYTDEELVVFWWGEGGNGKAGDTGCLGGLRDHLLKAHLHEDQRRYCERCNKPPSTIARHPDGHRRRIG
jgi:hypothetical protein